MMRSIILSIGFLCWTLNAVGQKVAIQGMVHDSSNDAPIEFATVSALDTANALVDGTVTDLDGKFVLNVNEKASVILIEYIGFSSVSIDLSDRTSADLGLIMMESGAVNLEEIQVIGEVSSTQYKLDKRVFNLGKDLATRGGSAEDVLNNVPSVTVDIEGNVSLRGSENVKILIDGKPSGLVGISGSSGLKSIQANQIERIEVITNPSARYEASGLGGIINIILKKNDSNGFNGSFEVNGGVPEAYGMGANVNYRKGDVNFFVNYGAGSRRSPQEAFSYQEQYYQDRTDAIYTTRDGNRGGINQSVQSGLNYYLPKKQILTGSFTYSKGLDENFTDIQYREASFSPNESVRSQVENLSTYTLRRDDENENDTRIQWSLDYEKAFSGKGRKLNGNIQYQNNAETENSDFTETLFSPSGSTSLPSQYSENSEGERKWIGFVDLDWALDESSKIESGVRADIRTISNDYEVGDIEDGVRMPISRLTNEFRYDENIYAAYSTYGREFGDLSYSVGLRLEHSEIRTSLEDTINLPEDIMPDNDRSYTNLFPSGFLNYKITEANQLQLSYSRRIRRPRFWDLNPFFTFSDRINQFSGNPDINPEFINSYEIGYLKFFESSNFNTTIFYRRTNDAIVRLANIVDGARISKPFNLGDRDDAGIELLYAFKGLKWLSFDSEASAFYQRYMVEEDEASNLNAEGFAFTGRLNTRWSLWDKADLQVRVNYRGPNFNPQGTRRSITSIDLGFGQDFLDDNLSLTINVRDLLNNRRRRYTNEGEDFFEEGDFQWRRRSITAAVSYRINTKKPRGRSGGNYEGGGDF